MTTTFLLSLGSNCGDRRENICCAIGWLQMLLRDVTVSEIYETDSISGDGTKYLNCVVRGTGEISSGELDKACKEFEISLGRDAACRAKGLVPIDVDVICAGDEILRPADYERSYFRMGLSALRIATP